MQSSSPGESHTPPRPISVIRSFLRKHGPTLSSPTLSALALLVAPICLALFLCFWNLGERSIIYQHDERTHISVVQEMLHTGKLFPPTIDGKLYLRKPPLKMWLSLIPVSVLGESNFSYRFIDAAAGVMTCALVFILGSTLLASRASGALAVLILLGNQAFLFEHNVRHAVQDSLMVLLSTVTVAAGWKLFVTLKLGEASKGKIVWYSTLTMAVATAGALLTKSVAGFTGIFVVFAFFLLVRFFSAILTGQRRLMARPLIALILVLALLPAAYFLPIYLLYPEEFLSTTQLELVHRITNGYQQAENPWFYLQQIFLRDALSPWPLLVAGSLYSLVAVVRKRSYAHLLLLVWVWSIVIAYSAIPSRCLHYLAPAFPGLALISAAPLVTWSKRLKDLGGTMAAGKLRAQLALAGAILFGSYLILTNLWEVSMRVVKDTRSTELDRVVKEVNQCSRSSKLECPVLLFKRPFLSDVENRYLKMLTFPAHTLSSAQELLSYQSDDTYVLASLEHLDVILDWGPRRLLTIPGREERSGPVIIATKSSSHDSARIPAVASIVDLATQQDALLLNWGQATVLKGNRGRANRGALLGVIVQGNDLLAGIASQLSLNLALAAAPLGGARSLVASINGTELPPLALRPSGFRTYALPIPANVLTSQRNVVIMKLLGPDGAPLARGDTSFVLNWIALRPSQRGAN